MSTTESDSEPGQAPGPNPIVPEISSFVHGVDALQASLPIQMAMASGVLIASQKRLNDFLENNCEKKNSEEVYTIGPEHFLEFNRLSSRANKASAATFILPQAFIISLVSQYDSFLGGLLRCLYRAKPELLQASERHLTYSQLCKFSDLEKAKEEILEKEIESILRTSHADQFDAMQKRFSLTLKKKLPIWPVFIELTERRNLFAHCNGKVSAHYLDVCDRHHVRHAKRPQVGDKLDMTPAYFAKAHDCVFEIGTKLAHVLWRKILPSEREDADNNLLTLGYDLLVAKNYNLAITMGTFAVEILKGHSSDATRRRLLINLAQAYKWTGNTDAAAKLLDAEDWSSCDTLFALAVAVLKKDFGKASRLMKLAAAAKILKKNDYRDWPLFNEFRESQVFIDTYQSVYGHDLSKIEPHPTDHFFAPLSEIFATENTRTPDAPEQSAPKQIAAKSAKS